jgi:hypothetical protein
LERRGAKVRGEEGWRRGGRGETRVRGAGPSRHAARSCWGAGQAIPKYLHQHVHLVRCERGEICIAPRSSACKNRGSDRSNDLLGWTLPPVPRRGGYKPQSLSRNGFSVLILISTDCAGSSEMIGANFVSEQSVGSHSPVLRGLHGRCHVVSTLKVVYKTRKRVGAQRGRRETRTRPRTDDRPGRYLERSTTHGMRGQ